MGFCEQSAEHLGSLTRVRNLSTICLCVRVCKDLHVKATGTLFPIQNKSHDPS